jgi:chromosome segregation ATPase
LEQVREEFNVLHAKNMGGEALDAAVRECEAYQAQIGSLPVYFLAGDKGAVIQASDKSAVIQAYSAALDTETGLDSLSNQTRGWDESHSQLQEKVDQMDTAVDELEGIIRDMPAGLVLSQERAQFEGSKVVSQNLYAAAARLSVEDIESLGKEVDHITRTSKDMGMILAQARYEFNQLSDELGAVTASLDSTSRKMASLGTSSIYPVAWGKSAAAVNGMKSRLAEMGGIDNPRTARQVTVDLKQCLKLKQGLEGLSAHVDQIELDHIELENIFSAPEFQDIDGWLSEAHQLVSWIQVYAPDNWARTDAAADLPADLMSVEKELIRLAPDSVPQPALETELGGVLTDSRALNAVFTEMRARLSRMIARLADIQAVEKTASDLLESGFTTLNQIKYLIRSNTYLSGTATQECERLLSELEKLRLELETREKESVERKAGRIETAISKIEKSAIGWSEGLNNQIKQEVSNITTSLKTLDGIAYLDENAIGDARQLLLSRDALDATQDKGAEGEMQLEDLPNQLKKRNDIWQTATAARSALSDVEKPVLESYQEAAANREAVTRLFKDSARLIKSAQKWPPTSVSFEHSRQEFKAVEAQWKSLKKEELRAIALVAQLGNLSIRYQRLAVDLDRSTERAKQELSRIKKLENDLGELTKAWSNHRKTYRENERASAGIRELLNDAKVELTRIKQDFKDMDTDYDQAAQELASLVSRIRTALVRIDDENMLDIDGNLIPAG